MVVVTAVSAQTYQIETENDTFHIHSLAQTAHTLCFEQDGLRDTLTYAFAPDGTLWLQYGWETTAVYDSLLDPPDNRDAVGSGNVVAPMPGSIQRIAVAVGDMVAQGQPLLILEAMKMEHSIAAPFAGTVVQILVNEGQQMQPKQLMVVVQP
jgi:propionyl-CoA carboxylase alpha chain